MTWPSVVVRTQMDAGPAKVRRRFTAAPEFVDVELKMTGEQLALLREFIYGTIAGGALPFEWKDHRTGDECEYRFVDVAQVQPRASRQNGTELWVVSFQLELMPAVTGPAPVIQPESEGPRSNFGWGFGTLDRGGIDVPTAPNVDGAFEHSSVPGSSDQGQPGGPTPVTPGTPAGGGAGGGCTGTAGDSSSSRDPGCAG